ncbi:hypothetical protein HJC23_004520 [Cyclotella cryptica]|uniref:PiggyBac transposable element-derived protein domain-containing protein n=1 Tax=Cyclotella cryptica TaxID=29204 RepID=A0ABD3P276_9STRA
MTVSGEALSQDRLNDLVAFKKDSARRQGECVTKNAIYFLTPSIPNKEAWAVMGFTRVIQECPEEKYSCMNLRSLQLLSSKKLRSSSQTKFYFVLVIWMKTSREFESSGSRDSLGDGMTYFEIFQKYIPLTYFEDVCVKRTSANLEDAGEAPTNLEFNEQTNPCPLKLSNYMSCRRMELIDHHISFTDRQAPSYTDRFWEVRQLMDEWRRNMKEIFYPSWALCLDESMSIWMNRYTCPGWVFCPRKPHPFGNEYHTICCAESGILFDFETSEGNDHPREMPAAEFADKALLELQKVGVFAGALIKKRRFWPALVPGNVIDRHFDEKEVGTVAAVGGSLDGVKYHIWAMKDAGYVTKIMGTASGLIYWDDRLHTRQVDGNGVNMFLGQKHFVWDGAEKQTLLDFRRNLAWDLIMNPQRVVSPQQPRTSKRLRNNIITHEKEKCPPYTSSWNANIVMNRAYGDWKYMRTPQGESGEASHSSLRSEAGFVPKDIRLRMHYRIVIARIDSNLVKDIAQG